MNKKTRAKIVGLLFLLALVTSVMGGSIIEYKVSEPDFLVTLFMEKTEIYTGILLELVCSVVVIFIGILMYPVFKEKSESLAMAYVGFRVMEAVTIVIAVMSPLVLLKLSQIILTSSSVEIVALEHMSSLFIDLRANILGLILVCFFSVNAIVFYYLVYQLKLIPRFIPIWGFVGVLFVFVMNLSGFLGYEMSIIMALPIISNELFLSVWLMVKGFKSNEIS